MGRKISHENRCLCFINFNLRCYNFSLFCRCHVSRKQRKQCFILIIQRFVDRTKTQQKLLFTIEIAFCTTFPRFFIASHSSTETVAYRDGTALFLFSIVPMQIVNIFAATQRHYVNQEFFLCSSFERDFSLCRRIFA